MTNCPVTHLQILVYKYCRFIWIQRDTLPFLRWIFRLRKKWKKSMSICKQSSYLAAKLIYQTGKILLARDWCKITGKVTDLICWSHWGGLCCYRSSATPACSRPFGACPGRIWCWFHCPDLEPVASSSTFTRDSRARVQRTLNNENDTRRRIYLHG